MLLTDFKLFTQSLESINLHRALITTINPHSYNVSRKDMFFHEALMNSDILLPDGIGIVLGICWLTGEKIKKIAGADLFEYEMEKMKASGGRVFFIGSTNGTLQKIKIRMGKDYPNIVVETYSPPFVLEFSEEESKNMIEAINAFKPDVLFIGMTAPKQEKWAYKYHNKIQAKHICCIGAVFDFYAGTIKRAPKWMISIGLEWLYRLTKDFSRMWPRNVGSLIFIFRMILEKCKMYQDLCK